ncbi:hypothetical protein [Vibrio algarum]|uniref:Uncharacterized protein n=1 Tax=Vibrio algarum TaxID=3020714 RepID=A0ABT4YXI1_9VIBR|nr:hypothetical protein [Vibrio sp. KJ40-1]MDB1126213.1 hypothetical protein [Vibrio sp. KJ40-1]
MNTKVGRYGQGLKVTLDSQSGIPKLLVKNEGGQVVKRINGAMVANKMSKGFMLLCNLTSEVAPRERLSLIFV